MPKAKRITACPFCDLADESGAVGAHLDSHIPEAAEAKGIRLHADSLHPVGLTRAIRFSVTRRTIVIRWDLPVRDEEWYVLEVYAKVIMLDPNWVSLAHHRTGFGDISADWWAHRIALALASYQVIRNKRHLQQTAMADIDLAKDIMINGIAAAAPLAAPAPPRPNIFPSRNQGCAIDDRPGYAAESSSDCARRGALEIEQDHSEPPSTHRPAYFTGKGQGNAKPRDFNSKHDSPKLPSREHTASPVEMHQAKRYRRVKDIVIDSDPPVQAINDERSCSPSPWPCFTLMIPSFGEAPIRIRVYGDMTLSDVLDRFWKSVPTAARFARDSTALFSDDERWRGPWDDNTWRRITSTAAMGPKPPVWDAKIMYVVEG